MASPLQCRPELGRPAGTGARRTTSEFRTLSANQLEFVNLILDHLTEHGAMQPARLYESPFTDIAAQGPDRLFNSSQREELVAVLETVRLSAVAA